MNLLFLGIGATIGASCRYVLGLFFMKKVTSTSFPPAMLFVNLLGSFGLGFFYGAYFDSFPIVIQDEPLYLITAVGFFGAFTTFSTFSIEAVQLFQEKLWKPFFAYVSLTIFGSIIMFVIGLFVFI